MYCCKVQTPPSWYIVLYFVVFTFSDLIHILIQAQATILWGFLDTSTRFIPTLSILTESLLMEIKFAIEIARNLLVTYPSMCIYQCLSD